MHRASVRAALHLARNHLNNAHLHLELLASESPSASIVKVQQQIAAAAAELAKIEAVVAASPQDQG